MPIGKESSSPPADILSAYTGRQEELGKKEGLLGPKNGETIGNVNSTRLSGNSMCIYQMYRTESIAH
jgi:hypothetical protein